MRKKRNKILRQIIKNSAIPQIACGFIVYYLIVGMVLWLLEPSMPRYMDALWYCFVSCTTIGFGDFAAATLIGRILTVLLYMYALVIIAIITAVVTNFFIEMAKCRRDESISLFMDDMEHLAELPKERLEKMSEIVRNLKGSK